MAHKVSSLGLLLFLYCLLPSAYCLQSSTPHSEYLWYEAENMRGFTTDARGEPVLNPSWMNLGREKAPGWGMNGPGVSAEWSQGGESEWNSAAASADETRAVIYQDVEVPRAGQYKFWVRYADWAGKTENFTVRITEQGRELFRHEFGARDVIDRHDEVSMYWGWAYAWDSAQAELRKGPARISVEIEHAAEARRNVDCLLLTNDIEFVPEGRRKPDFAALKLLREWYQHRTQLEPLIADLKPDAPASWRPQPIAGRDFLMPWNISKEFWKLYEKPARERPLYPFNAEPTDEFIKKYAGAESVPIFNSKLVVPVIYIADLPEYLKEGGAFLKYLRETRAPFAVLINYGSANWQSDAEAQAAWKLLTGELREQFIGWISGESIGHVWPDVAANLKLSPAMARAQMLEALRAAYTRSLEKKWGTTFHAQTGAMWDKLIPALSTSSTTFAHALFDWGVHVNGIETSAVQPATALRIAFSRGAAREFGGAFLYYHAPNFGDTATTFTKSQNFSGPDYFYHMRYGPAFGPSLSWYRKSYYLYYMAGASAIYLEQGQDQFFKPGPGENPFQLNPLGRITDEFVRFAEKHHERGTPVTPVAFLLNPAHGWEMTDYPQWPFGVAQIGRSDRALRELFGAAFHPLPEVEGEPANSDRQPFINAIFGDIYDVLTASASHRNAIDSYSALIVGGQIEWDAAWAQKLTDYIRAGGTVFLNAAQSKRLSEDFTGAHLTGANAETDNAHCLLKDGRAADLRGQMFRYEHMKPGLRSRVLIETEMGDPLIIMNTIGRGRVIFSALPDNLGEDERLTPFVAHLLAHLFADAAPVRVEGNVEYLINRMTRGYVVTLFNNNGVFKSQQGVAQVDRSASVRVTLSLKGKGIGSVSEWAAEKRLEVNRDGAGDNVKLEIAPGGVAIVELIESH